MKEKYNVKKVIEKLGNNFPLNEINTDIKNKEYFEIKKMNYIKLNNKETSCNVKIHFNGDIVDYILKINFDTIGLLEDCKN